MKGANATDLTGLDLDRCSILTRYFFLSCCYYYEEAKIPRGNFCTEADFTQKSFALKAFPFELSLYVKIVVSGTHRTNSMYGTLLGPRQVATYKAALRQLGGFMGLGV